MSYTIHKSDGTPITVPDNVIDWAYYNSTGGGGGFGLGTQLVGRNAVNYGAPIAQNFLQMTENFASPTVPSDATTLLGQLWFNKTDDGLYVKTSTATGGGSLSTGGMSTLVGGGSYLPGSYTNVPLTGGSGAGARATIVVNGATVVSSVVITTAGSGYLVGDHLSALATDLGVVSTPYPFNVLVSAVTGGGGGLGNWQKLLTVNSTQTGTIPVVNPSTAPAVGDIRTSGTGGTFKIEIYGDGIWNQIFPAVYS